MEVSTAVSTSTSVIKTDKCSTSIKTKQSDTLYPELTDIKDLSSLKLSSKHKDKNLEILSIDEFYENDDKNLLTKHARSYMYKFLNEHDKVADNDWFYCMVQQYLKSTIELTTIKDRVLEINDHCSKLRSNVWSIENAVATKNSVCKDNINVTASFDFKIAKLQQSILVDLERNSKKLRDCCHKDYINFAHKSLLLKLKVWISLL